MANLPTLYEYYTDGGITQGLSVDQPYFTLNKKNITLYSGSMHYFRVPQEYWRDRLRKMRAAGLNAVQTYVPWNLHEPIPGIYDFGQGGTDMQEFLDIEKFLRTVQEEDLLAILRPGPYICGEFEFGGLPSWLLREEDIKFRTSDEKYMKHVRRYFSVLLTLLASLQFTLGGPIIAFQVENEYGSTTQLDTDPPFIPDSTYIEQLRQLMLANNITELLFTSDSPYDFGSLGSLSSLFQTANFDTNPEEEFGALEEIQKGKPLMATEFWAGWFNHWSETPYEGNASEIRDIYDRILKYPASVSIYMFHGGTTWGFLNGANMQGGTQDDYIPDITSYDYDAPLTEYGDYTEKYFAVKELIEEYRDINTKLPEMPNLKKHVTYPSVQIEEYLPYAEIVRQLPYKIGNRELLSMELLPINNNTGQQLGYILYRKKNISINPRSVLTLVGYVHDAINVYINNVMITTNVVDLDEFGYWKIENGTLELSSDQTFENATLDLVVENLGRINYGHLELFYQYKGLWEGVFLDNEEIFDWEIYPVEFKSSWSGNLSKWINFEPKRVESVSTGLYKATLVLTETSDTFLDMSDWNKGLVIVNNFVLGRYWRIGPQQSLYLPAPLLTVGENEIFIFEQFLPNSQLKFSKDPIRFNNDTRTALV